MPLTLHRPPGVNPSNPEANPKQPWGSPRTKSQWRQPLILNRLRTLSLTPLTTLARAEVYHSHARSDSAEIGDDDEVDAQEEITDYNQIKYKVLMQLQPVKTQGDDCGSRG